MSMTNDSPGEEIVTTVYINGFPDDFKERELQNMFTFAKGFEGCSLRVPNSADYLIDTLTNPFLRTISPPSVCRQILGFVRFSTLSEALEACQLLNGRIIDVEKGYTLRAELAKKNLVIGSNYAKGSRSNSGLLGNISMGNNLDAGFNGSGGNLLFGPNLLRRQSLTIPSDPQPEGSSPPPRSLSLAVPGSPNPISITAPTFRAQSFVLNDNVKAGSNLLNGAINIPIPQPTVDNGANNISGLIGTSPGSMIGNIPMENPPCNTLYIGNLPVNASELELRSIFAMMSGFRRMSFKTKAGGSPMCFVEFEDIKNATHAMHALYGTMLSNSIKGGIRISYSKNPLGMRSNPQAGSNLFLGGNLYLNEQFPNSILDSQLSHDPLQSMASYTFPGIIDS